MLNEIMEDRAVQLIHDLLSIALGEYELGVPKRSEVSGDRRPCRRKVVGDLARALGAVAEQAENLAPGGIGEGTEGVHPGNICIVS